MTLKASKFMKLSEFDYHIPDNRIAQHPLKERDASKLFIIHRRTATFEHRRFKDIVDYLCPGDVLILNDTRVIPVRLRCVKPSGGKAEITLLRELAKNSWESLVKGVHEGKVILKRGITAHVSRLNGTAARVDFDINSGLPKRGKNDIKNFLHDVGVMPLPIYIKREAVTSDSGRYQTVYAKKDGAIAAPTAGLHFTDDLIHSIKEKGIHVKTITLHVGYGTFKPVTAEDVRDHKMDEEYFEIPRTTASAINAARADGRRVIAVGTTVTRALEASAKEGEADRIAPGAGKSSIFIYPGYRFTIVDALITNFHLPKSTPMMLASAFSELALLKKAYSVAQHEGYRFYSYGDAMMII
jgi:S-adenosylmethionine:tRNA ribosyltransferase-isomerase